jgi:hypothetical protein
MNTTTQHKTAPKTPSKPNGTSTTEHPEQPTAHTTPVATAPASDKKPVTVMIPEGLHRKVKVLAELSGTSLSDLVEGQLKTLVKERLPGLLASLDSGE